MLWLLAFSLPMAFLIGACLDAVPQTHRCASQKIGWLLIVPILFSLIAFIPLMPFTMFMVTAGALGTYYIIRAFSVLAIDSSYRAFARDNNLPIAPIYTLLAWIVAFVEPLLMLALFVVAFATNWPGAPLTHRGMGEVMLIVTITIASGIGFAYLYLMGAYGNRKLILHRSAGRTRTHIPPKGTAIRPTQPVPARPIPPRPK